MKKMTILTSTILGMFLVMSTIANSQSVAYLKPESIWLSENGSKDHSFDVADENPLAANPRSVETFKKIFGNASNVIWSKIDRNHDRAYFNNNGITVRAGFDKKGKLMYTLKYYAEEHLPQDILLTVKKTYYGKSIFGVVEVSVDGKTAYMINLEDKTSWLRIKVLDDEITEEQLMLKR